jgi:hypothetical protein
MVLLCRSVCLLPENVLLVSWMQDEKRDRFKLILNCIMIITSVIPPGNCSSAALTVRSRTACFSQGFSFCRGAHWDTR